jgi:hypothetical protein
MSQYFLTNVGVDAILMVDATSGNETVSLPRGYASGRKLTVRGTLSRSPHRRGSPSTASSTQH